MKLFLSAIAFAFVFLFGSCATFAPSIPDVSNSVVQVRVQKSYLFCPDGNCQWVSVNRKAGSGAVIAKNKVLTAGHVCDLNINPLDLDMKSKGRLKADIVVVSTNHMSWPGVAQRVDDENDLCLILLDRPTNLKPLKLAKTKATPYATYSYWGFPKGFNPPGVTPMFTGQYLGEFDGRGIYNFVAYPGASGAPVVDRWGRIIGMVVAYRNGANHIAISPTLGRIAWFLMP